jgi:hypothetical protein
MKKHLTLLFFCGSVLFGGAQLSVAQTDSSPVVVHSFHWRTNSRNEWSSGSKSSDLPDYGTGDLNNPARRTSTDPQRLQMPPTSIRDYRTYFKGYESSLQLENVGAKTITSVEWEHLFFSDDEKRNEVKRFSFSQKTNIAPGEQKFIGQHVRPKRRLKLPTATRQSVIINRIIYADGSVWRRS